MLSDILDRCVRGPRSPCQLIQHSAELQTWFAELCTQHDPNGNMETHNLRAAKHRFESFSMPLNRICRHFHALLSVAIKAAHMRTDKAGTGCAEFLQWVTTPSALLLGMMADAGDEALCLTRFFDKETVDVAEMNVEVDRFLRRVESMFGSSPQCFILPGFTKLMLDKLSSPIVWVLRGKQLSLGRVGGPSEEEKQHCLDRMRCWLKLCRAELAAEFPDFELAQARPQSNCQTCWVWALGSTTYLCHLVSQGVFEHGVWLSSEGL